MSSSPIHTLGHLSHWGFSPSISISPPPGHVGPYNVLLVEPWLVVVVHGQELASAQSVFVWVFCFLGVLASSLLGERRFARTCEAAPLCIFTIIASFFRAMSLSSYLCLWVQHEA